MRERKKRERERKKLWSNETRMNDCKMIEMEVADGNGKREKQILKVNRNIVSARGWYTWYTWYINSDPIIKEKKKEIEHTHEKNSILVDKAGRVVPLFIDVHTHLSRKRIYP